MSRKIQQVSDDADGPARRAASHLIACRAVHKATLSVVNRSGRRPTVDNAWPCYQVLSTIDNRLSLVHRSLATVGVPWSNFISPHF